TAAFADKTHSAPCASAAYRRQATFRRAGSIERQIGAQAVGALLDPGNRGLRAGVNEDVGAKLLGAREALFAHIQRNDARPHDRSELRCGHADRSLANDGDRVPFPEIHSPERLKGSAGAAGNGRAGHKAKLIRQGYGCWCGNFQIARMRAVPGDAIDDGAVYAHLRPAGPAVGASAAAAVVVHHDPLADAGRPLRDIRPYGCHGAAWLVSGDHWTTQLSEPERS